MTRRLVAGLVIALLAGCARASVVAAPPSAPVAPSDDGLADELSMLAVGAPATDAQRARLGQATNGGAVEALVDELLADPRFSREVAPEILFNKRALDPAEEDAWDVLTASGSPPVYHLRAPCADDAAVRVHPWWAMDTEVLVCPDSYQPTHLRQADTGWYCGGDNLAPQRSGFCGCGPNLMSCARSEAQARTIKAALIAELADTVAWIVESDQPVDRVFTSNETVRTGYSQLFYERWEVVAGLRPAVSGLAAWDADKKPAPRREMAPGEHAGLLTSPQILLFGDTPRARMRNAYNDLWCVSPSSVDVTAKAVLDLGATDLRDGEGWRKLAAMPVCGDCHARLDFGMQFFAGYPSSFVGVTYAPPHADRGKGPLYGFGMRDARGEGALSPLGFATMAVKQPEFGRCVVRDVTDHVRNGEPTAEDRRALAAAFDAKRTLRAVMREALLRRPRRTAEAPRVGREGDLFARVEAHCGGCHASGAHAFKKDALTPELLGRMLRAVAFGEMPRAPVEMTDGERSGMVGALVRALFGDEERRREAMRYFDGGMRGLAVHRGTALVGLVEERTGRHDPAAAAWTFSDADRHDAAEARPSFLSTYALEALAACKMTGASGDELRACLARALDVRAATKARR